MGKGDGFLAVPGSHQDDDADKNVEKKISNFAEHTAPQNSSTWIWPNTLHTNDVVTGAAAGTLYAPADISMYNMHLLVIEDFTATSIDVFGTVDGVTANRAALDVYNFATQSYQANIVANGAYAVGDKAGMSGLKTVEYDQVGAGAVTLRYSHSVN